MKDTRHAACITLSFSASSSFLFSVKANFSCQFLCEKWNRQFADNRVSFPNLRVTKKSLEPENSSRENGIQLV